MKQELLLIDDDEILLIILEKMFHKVNPKLQIHPFSTGREGLSFMESITTDPKPLSLVDINLKDMSGWEFLEEMERNFQDQFQVILITSSVHSDNPIKSRRYKSVIGFYEKPITFDMIQDINQLIVGNIQTH